MRNSPQPPPDPPADVGVAPPETRRVRSLQRAWAGLQRSAARAEHAADRALIALRSRIGSANKLSILTYRGFGSDDGVTVLGRVVEARTGALPSAEDSRWQNFRRVFRYFNTREVAGAQLTIRHGDARMTTLADEEGFFRARLPLPGGGSPGWDAAEIELTGCHLPGWKPIVSRAEVLVPSPQAAFGIISDIDDTVLETHVTQRLRMVWVTVSRNAHTRLAFPGTTELYRALVAGPQGRGDNPVFYVSKSPWNLYDFLIEFLDRHGLPRGPLFLRDVGLRAEAPLDFKSAAIDDIFATYPRLPFVLVGDSGERDPDIYVETAARHPGRVRAIYIREVRSSRRRRQELEQLAIEAARLGTQLLYVGHAEQAAEHARSFGLTTA